MTSEAGGFGPFEPLSPLPFPPLNCLFPCGLESYSPNTGSKIPSTETKGEELREKEPQLKKAVDCRVVIMAAAETIAGEAVAERLQRLGLQVEVTTAVESFKKRVFLASLNISGTEIAFIFVGKQRTRYLTVDISFLGAEPEDDLEDQLLNKTVLQMIQKKYKEHRELVLGEIPDLVQDIARRFAKEEIGLFAETLFLEFIQKRLNIEAQFTYRTNNGLPVLKSQVKGFIGTPDFKRLSGSSTTDSTHIQHCTKLLG